MTPIVGHHLNFYSLLFTFGLKVRLLTSALTVSVMRVCEGQAPTCSVDLDSVPLTMRFQFMLECIDLNYVEESWGLTLPASTI
jgi:hypothetical protein